MKTLFFCLFLLITTISYVSAQEVRDFYIWNKAILDIGLSEKTNLKVSLKNHYLISEEQQDMSYLDLNLGRKMNDWLQLGVAFRTSEYKSNDDLIEYRPQGYVNLSKIVYGIKLRTTNRIAYRIFNKQDGYFRYYQNFFLNFPTLGFIPGTYIGEELFTKLNGFGLHLGRFYGGVNVWKNDWLKLDMFYGLQKLKQEDWTTADIMGLNMTFSI